jgi:hypothetical protein
MIAATPPMSSPSNTHGYQRGLRRISRGIGGVYRPLGRRLAVVVRPFPDFALRALELAALELACLALACFVPSGTAGVVVRPFGDLGRRCLVFPGTA